MKECLGCAYSPDSSVVVLLLTECLAMSRLFGMAG